MKKLLFVLCLLFAGSGLFANIELDSYFYSTVFNLKSLNSDFAETLFDETSLRQGLAFGEEDAVSIFFGDRASKFDFGLGFITSFDVYSNLSNSSEEYEGLGINLGLGMGPVLRYTFTDKFSLFTRPAFLMNAHYFNFADNQISTNNIRIVDFSLGVDWNIGGRSWLLNREGFHLGLAYGADFIFTAGSGQFYNDGYSTNDYSLNTTAFKLYFGVCMNFGDRGVDR